MLKSRRSRITLLALVIALVAAPAAAQNLFVFRAESIDGAVGDIEALVRAAGGSADRDAVMAPLRQILGISDTTFLDGGRPLIVAMPMNGTMLGPKGLVAVVPVVDPARAIEAVAGAFAGHETMDDGTHVFSTASGPALYVRVLEGFLVAGGNRDLTTAFDAGPALRPGRRPEGNMSMEMSLEQLEGMMQMSLAGMKQQIISEMQRDMARKGAAVPFDAAKIGSLMDVYFEFLQAMLSNVARFQIVLEVTGSDVLIHERITPKPDSTFAGLVAAQKTAAGFPKLGRMIEPDAMMVSVGRMEMTPAFAEAAKGLVKQYLGAVFPLLQDMLSKTVPGEETAPASLDPLLAEVEGAVERHFRCAGSESAASFDLVPGSGVSVRQIYDWKTTPDCAVDPAQEVARNARILDQLPVFRDFISFAEGPRVEGARTITTTVNIGTLLDSLAGAQPDVRKAVGAIYGESLTVQEAYTDGMYVTAASPGPDSGLDALLDARHRMKGKGLTAELFAPLPRNAASFVLFDVGRLLNAIRGLVPPEELAQKPGLAAAFDAFSGEAGRIRFGIGFDDEAMTVHGAASFATVEAIGKLAGVKPAEAPAPTE